MKKVFVATVLALGLGAVGGSGHAAICAADTVPAATLLVPYFEVDIDQCGMGAFGRNTTITVNNTAREAKLAHVTLWTNAGVPVFTFDIYLAGFARQDLDLSSVLCDAALPSTGAALDQGFITAPVNFPGCNNTATVGDAPLYGGAGAIAADELAALRAALTGQPDPVSGTCAGFDDGSNVARGYVTIDNVPGCTTSNPASPGYVAVEIGYENVLSGQFALIDGANNFSVGFPAVAIEAADPGVFQSGDVTFYGRYTSTDASDRREPLATTYAPRFSNDGGFASTDLLVWRETSSFAAPFSCTAGPPWAPLGQTNVNGNAPVFAMDEDGNHLPLSNPGAFPAASQRVNLAQAFPSVARQIQFGALWMNLQHDQTAYGNATSGFGQAWATSVLQSGGRFSTAAAPQPLDSSCNGASFDNVSDGPAALSPF